MAQDLIRFLSEVGAPRIGVVGDAILDQYVWGGVERVSPEAPIQVLRVDRRELRAGGAGSVVTNLARLGAQVSFFSVRGDDADGHRLAKLLREDGVDLEGFVAEPGRRTTVKTRHLGYVQHANRAVQQLLRVDDEELEPLAPGCLKSLLEAFSARARELDVVLVSDYLKGLIGEELMRSLRETAPAVPVIVDPARRADYGLYRGSYLICPNRYEAQTASGLGCRDIDGCAAAARRLREMLDIEAVALTMDAAGIFLDERGGAVQHFPTEVREVTDVTGAGDMVLTVLGFAFAGGGRLSDAVTLANIAGGIVVRQVGVTPVTRDHLITEIRYQGHPAANKIKERDEILRIVTRARAAGRTIAFANGCFDLLHPGHHHLLTGAAREGDILVVAVNSDASVSRNKGAGRPRVSENSRLMMVAGLEAVDYVVCFDEDTPIPLLDLLRPDVLVKGAEYRDGVVVGRELVESYGGRVALVPHLEGYSTTAVLEGRLVPPKG